MVSSSASRASANASIEWVYHPSTWEQKWIKLMANLHDTSRYWDKGCAALREDKAKVDEWLTVCSKRQSWDDNYTWSKDILSYHTATEISTGRKIRDVPIEPLVGFLRHPLYVCLERKNKLRLNKYYMLPSWNQEIELNSTRKTILFDLGASTYDSGPGGASQSWFVEQYQQRGITFEDIYDWEATPLTAKEIYDPMPNDVANASHYYDVPVNAVPGDKYNPLRTLVSVATPDDFVVVKIDIDNSPIEEALVNQILTDTKISSRIDEFYFEHHVWESPMDYRGWQASRDHHMQSTLSESYTLFEKLRQLGIRAHSWV